MPGNESQVILFSDELPRDHWLARQLPGHISLREYAEERAILAAARIAETAMNDAHVSRGMLAERLGASKAFVSQILNGSRNMTMRTLGSILWACGQELQDVFVRPFGYVPGAALPNMASLLPLPTRGAVETTKPPYWGSPHPTPQSSGGAEQSQTTLHAMVRVNSSELVSKIAPQSPDNENLALAA